MKKLFDIPTSGRQMREVWAAGGGRYQIVMEVPVNHTHGANDYTEVWSKGELSCEVAKFTDQGWQEVFHFRRAYQTKATTHELIEEQIEQKLAELRDEVLSWIVMFQDGE